MSWQHKERNMEHSRKLVQREIYVYDRGNIANQGERKEYLSNNSGTISYPYEKSEIDPFFTKYSKINSTSMKNLHEKQFLTAFRTPSWKISVGL